MRQTFIRYKTTFRTLEQKTATLQTANSDQQTINDQLQTNVSTGLARLSAFESTGSAVSDCSPALAAQAKQLEERINHVVASLGDISKFARTSAVSNQLQTLSDRIQQRTAAVVKEWKMSNFKIEKFDDYHKTDPLQWWMAFNVEADAHHVPPLRRLNALYLQLIGGAQAFMTHMVITLECTIATLNTEIFWEEFEKKWKTRFMVNNDKHHALNKIFHIFQGQQTSREWLTEWQRLVATPELNLLFNAIRAEFFARSCDGLTAALGSEFQYETFNEMISKARELIQVSLTSGDSVVVASSRIHFENYVVQLVPPLNQPLHVQDSSACSVLPPSNNEPVASPTLLSEDPATWASLEALDPLTVENFQWLPLPSTDSLPTPHCNALMAHLREYLHAAVPPPSTDDGVAVVDLRSYLAKIDREHTTQRYVDGDAPLLYIPIQIGKATCSSLIDCGATRNYIIQDFMARVGLGQRVRRKSQPTHVTLADGHTQKSIDRFVESVPVYYAPLACEAVSFDILDTKFDMILGMSWLQSEDHPIEIQPRDRYKIAFKTRYGYFEWIVILFGLTNAPATFQAAMTTKFRDLLDRTVLIYLDDILVYSRSLDEHLRAVLERLHIAKYKANRDKCEFAQQELDYLGHYVTPQGIRPLEDKVQAIRDWSDVACTINIRSFLGLASYYMCFVKSFQRIVAPLTRLQFPLVPFKLNDEALHAFHTLKTALLQAPVLSIYDPTLPTKVDTDASGNGIGAVLEQHDSTDWHPVEYFNQKVPPINSLDDARKKELLAFVIVLKRWRHFLLRRRRFTWATDNNPLTYYKTQDTVSSTIGRWMYFIDEFDFTSNHILGPSNKAADGLSRRPDLCALVHSTFGLDEDLQQHFVNGYKSDPGFSTVYADLSLDQPPTSIYPIVDGYLLLHT
ncbi:hypothetical protein CBR_g18712 [Chara braunii]|uniref:Reverse transcriptase domain-containing protein n=1 Tax=Chara braunii TaxID=69332 RepID=A0A388KW88_CHABU|nr:hypothetical protein CBR_g18712 [Chara braunii]|eukprot:GBG74301.1 hypothetical protein CBR_g18712 [Chara braunii]